MIHALVTVVKNSNFAARQRINAAYVAIKKNLHVLNVATILFVMMNPLISYFRSVTTVAAKTIGLARYAITIMKGTMQEAGWTA